MTKEKFIKSYYSDALKCQQQTGISAIATLMQAAWESAWGAAAPGNMFFGQKDTDGLNGNEQLLQTTEVFTRPDVKLKQKIISITPFVLDGKKFFRYRIWDYFRKYDTPAECFIDHCNFLLRNPRYAEAVKYRADPEMFIKLVAKAGYATEPRYAEKLLSILPTIKKYIPR